MSINSVLFGVVTKRKPSMTLIESQTAGSVPPIRLLGIGILVIAAMYCLQVFSPMRLVEDGVVYMSLATSAVDGHGFVYHGSPERYPLGYPALVYLLVKLGLGYSWAFNALNCIFLALGVVASYHALRAWLDMPRDRALLLCCMTMLSFIVVKHVTQLVSDTVFFGASMSCVWALVWAERSEQTRTRCYRVAVAFGLGVFATSVRLIGIALPPIIFVAVGGVPALKMWWQTLRQRRGTIVVAAMSALTLAIIAGTVITRTQYFHMAMSNYRARGLWVGMTKAIEFLVEEWGEFAANVPQAKLPAPLRPLIFMAGTLAMAMAAAGMWRRRHTMGVLEVYLLGYLIILLAAPWQDTRYLLPILPLLLGYLTAFAGGFLTHRPIKFLAATYLLYFALLGVAALAYSTRITFAGQSFPDVYGDGTMRPTYRAAYRESTLVGSGQVDPDALDLLLRYEPRLRR